MLRFKVWHQLTTSVYACAHLIDGVAEGDINTLLLKACNAYKPSALERLDIMTALAKLTKARHTSVAELIWKISSLVKRRRMDDDADISDADKKTAILRACLHDQRMTAYVRQLTVDHKYESYNFVCDKLTTFETTLSKWDTPEHTRPRHDNTRAHRRPNRATLTRQMQSNKICPTYASGRHCRQGAACPMKHIRKQRPQQQPPQMRYKPQPTKPRSGGPECFNCGETGHYANACNKPKQQQVRKPKQNWRRKEGAKAMQECKYDDEDLNRSDVAALFALTPNERAKLISDTDTVSGPQGQKARRECVLAAQDRECDSESERVVECKSVDESVVQCDSECVSKGDESNGNNCGGGKRVVSEPVSEWVHVECKQQQCEHNQPHTHTHTHGNT